MPLLSTSQLATALSQLPGWAVDDGMLVRAFTFDEGFMRGVAFVHAVAEAAEAADHHPDIDIRWTTITVRAVTHSDGGISEKDVALAAECNRLAAQS